jgi:RsiW-degrading membrane proteinase PrsW (M82 family)
MIRCVCGREFDAAAGDVACPECGAILEVRAGKVQAACGCGATIMVPESMRGKPTPCTSCVAHVLIPADALPAQPRLKVPASDVRRAVDTKGRRPYLFSLLLLPLLISILRGEPDLRERMERTRQQHAEEAQRAETVDGFLKALPGQRAEGAFLPRTSWVPWAFAGVAAVAFWGILLYLFPTGRANSLHLWTVGLLIGTVGVLLLWGFQFVALHSRGLQGGGWVGLIVLSILHFIGDSYALALDPSKGFLKSLAGFTFGVGLCEEVCKMLPLAIAFRLGALLDVRGAVAWGLAMGVGFGVSEGIHYSGEYYNGVAGASLYGVRFISCVALHAVWSGTAALFLWSSRGEFEEPEHWYGMITPLILAVAPSMALHGLYDTLLKRDQDLLAFLVAGASYACFFRLGARYCRREALLETPVPGSAG